MNDQKLREEFEAWASSPDFGLRAGHFVKGDDGEYLNYPTQCYWQVWQASRAALVIELPPVRPEPVSSGDSIAADGEAASWNIWVGDKLAKAECREAIEAAGVRVKP